MHNYEQTKLRNQIKKRQEEIIRNSQNEKSKTNTPKDVGLQQVSANNTPSFDLVKPLLSRLLPPEFLLDFRTPWKKSMKKN